MIVQLQSSEAFFIWSFKVWIFELIVMENLLDFY